VLTIVVPKGVRTRHIIYSPADADTFKNPTNWINPKQRLLNAFSLDTMA
jgi:hypothetical protein